MEVLNILVAAAASYGFGAIWYMVLSKRWMEASGVEISATTGKPANASDPVPYVTAFVAAIIVAGLMRHVFESSGIVGLGKGLVTGLGIGLFLVSPWIATFYGFANRSRALVLIDSGYATLGCGLMGAILVVF